MPLTTPPIPPITESQILTSYLIPPAPLPTILPYNLFLNLVPATHKNNPEYKPALKHLYRDLQFQRSYTIEQVRDNIERECGAKAATLRARLARQIALEEGDREDEEDEGEERKRKRRRVDGGGIGSEMRQDEDEDQDDEGSMESSDDEFTNPLHLAAQRTMYEHMSDLHPAVGSLPISENVQYDQVRSMPASAFHTKESLLTAMSNASASLDKEIAELEAECGRMREQIGETVGALSDLRYGRRQSASDTDGEEYRDVLEALEQFRNVAESKIKA